MREETLLASDVLQDARRAFQEDVLRRIPEHDTHEIGSDFYAPDAYLCPWSGGAFFGLDHVRAFWRAMLEAGLTTLRFEQQWIEQCGNLAYEIGHYAMEYRPAMARGTAREAIRLEGSYLAVLREREDGAWRIAAEMYTCLGGDSTAAHVRMPARASDISRKKFPR
jgi:ketosteroid isomerase-like protein